MSVHRIQSPFLQANCVDWLSKRAIEVNSNIKNTRCGRRHRCERLAKVGSGPRVRPRVIFSLITSRRTTAPLQYKSATSNKLRPISLIYSFCCVYLSYNLCLCIAWCSYFVRFSRLRVLISIRLCYRLNRSLRRPPQAGQHFI